MDAAEPRLRGNLKKINGLAKQAIASRCAAICLPQNKTTSPWCMDAGRTWLNQWRMSVDYLEERPKKQTRNISKQAAVWCVICTSDSLWLMFW